MATPLPPIDARGRTIRVGDIVRVRDVPDLSDMAPKYRAETQAVFAHVRGTRKRVKGFGEYGHVHLMFEILRGPHAGWHGVWIEPNLLLVQPRSGGA